MEVPRFDNFACARAPSADCFIGQLNEDGKKFVISAFDPMQGKAREALTLDAHPGALHNWMPSPDGSHIVFIYYSPVEGRINLLSLKGEPDRDIVVKGWAGFNSVDWDAISIVRNSRNTRLLFGGRDLVASVQSEAA